MKLSERLKASIRRRSGNVILRSELAGLGSASQLSVALRDLQREGVLRRLGSGVYVKTQVDSVTGEPVVVQGLESLAQEAFEKLGMPVRVVPCGHRQSKKVRVEVIGAYRFSRHLSLGTCSIAYEAAPAEAKGAARNSVVSVAEKVRAMAKRHKVAYAATAVDRWAETATRLAGNRVRSGKTENLLQALHRSGKVDKKEMTKLLVQHLREEKGVRSV